MRFVWFWTFWHWSKESFRQGSLLRSPVHGVGSHWDEWFRHEASAEDLRAIAETGRTQSSQRRFIAWLHTHWAREAGAPAHRMVTRFVLAQLAQLPPFNRWREFERYRTRAGVAGISALVLAENSAGEPEDVRAVDALVLPAEPTGPAVLPEGFQAEATEFETIHIATRSLLCGAGLLLFQALWIAGGRRPHPRWLSVVLSLGWAAVAGLILLLWLGPEPGEQLFLHSALLMALWSGLIVCAAAGVARQSFRAWRVGSALNTKLECSQVRLHMSGGLTLKGGSAGLPFCLNTLLALYGSEPKAVRGAWLWHRLFTRMRAGARGWAGTGVLTRSGFLKPVVLEPKLRACLQQERIGQVLTPLQQEAGGRAVTRLVEALEGAEQPGTTAAPRAARVRFGFAAEKPALRVRRCRHLAQSLMALGEFRDRWQITVNAFALLVSAIMIAALPDLRSILLPHPAPQAVAPASTSPYDLWVSLDTKHPRYFSVVLESGYWSNRRAEVKAHGGVTPSVRAEIHFHRLTGRTTASENDGDVWVERRRWFLTREFNPGERVGHYSIPYLSRLGHE